MIHMTGWCCVKASCYLLPVEQSAKHSARWDDLMGACLLGQVVGHPRFPDGITFVTPPVAKFKKGELEAKARTVTGAEYNLIGAHPPYIQWQRRAPALLPQEVCQTLSRAEVEVLAALLKQNQGLERPDQLAAIKAFFLARERVRCVRFLELAENASWSHIEASSIVQSRRMWAEHLQLHPSASWRQIREEYERRP